MTLSQQIALGVLTSVLGAALWEFLNRVSPEIKSSLRKTVSACSRAGSTIYLSFKETSSLIGKKLNITFFVKVVKDVALVVVSVVVYGCVIFGAIYQISTLAEKVFASPTRHDAVTSMSSSTCECPPLTRRSSYSQSALQQPRISPSYRPRPAGIIYTTAASPDLVISEGPPDDCFPARKGRKSKRSRKSGTIVTQLSFNSDAFDGGTRDISQ